MEALICSRALGFGNPDRNDHQRVVFIVYGLIKDKSLRTIILLDDDDDV